MSGHVFVVSEWLPKENCEQELWKQFKQLMALTLEQDSIMYFLANSHPRFFWGFLVPSIVFC
jgi:hypothetical protein